MANIGFKGGDVLDVDLYNRNIDILNYYKKANFILSSNAATTNASTNTTQRFSFKQQRSYLTLIKVLISKDAIATFTYPRILSSVDRNDIAVVYTHQSDSVESFIKEDRGGGVYNIYILKTKYSTAHASDVWMNIRLLAGSDKDFYNSSLSQWLVVQHEDSETLLPKIARETTSNMVNKWQPVKSFLESSTFFSYANQISDTLDEPFAFSEILFDFDFDDYLKEIEGFCSDDVRIGEILYDSSRAVDSTYTSYAKGDYFDKIDYSFLGYKVYFLNTNHISFKNCIYTVRIATNDMSISSVDLMMMKWFVDAYSLFYGKMKSIGSDLESQSKADSNAQVEIVVNSDNYFTLGTDIKIYFEL